MTGMKGRLRDELLNENLFIDLDQARRLIAAWVADYNTARPHSSRAGHLCRHTHRAEGRNNWKKSGNPVQGWGAVQKETKTRIGGSGFWRGKGALGRRCKSADFSIAMNTKTSS
jgi:Integrase core domain